MTVLTLPTGPIKRDLIQMAFEECGQSAEFGIEPEEYVSALRRLNAMLSEWQAAYGIVLGYTFPAYGDGDVSEVSGIPPAAAQVVVTALAMRIAPVIGKTLSAETRAAHAASFSNLRSSYTVPPTMSLRADTPRGAGNRGWYGPYLRSEA